MNLNKKGMTLVELIISIAFLSLIIGFLYKVLLDVKYEKDNAGFAINNQLNRSEIIKFIQDDFEKLGLLSVSVEDNEITFTFNEENKKLVIEDKTIIYGDRKWTINENNYSFGDIELEEINDEYMKIIIPVVNAFKENDSRIDDIMLFTKYKVIEEDLYFKDVILKHAIENDYLYETTPTYSNYTTDGEYGLYQAPDDYGTSYYFRGDVENNYVKMGTWKETKTVYRGADPEVGLLMDFDTLEECQAGVSLFHDRFNIGGIGNCEQTHTYAEVGDPMYWRIVRINGDGTVRLVYDGTEAVDNDHTHEAMVGLSYYGTVQHKGAYVYEKDGVLEEANVKKIIDDWYEKNLKTSYGSYLADSIFCNDYSISETIYQHISGLPYYYHNAYLRSLWTPSLECITGQKLTVSENQLKYPVGLLTVEEASMSGLYPKYSPSEGDQNVFYLYSEDIAYLTMSGADYPVNDDILSMGISIYSGIYGSLFGLVIEDPTAGIRPVINIKAKVKVAGSGTVEDPYILK